MAGLVDPTKESFHAFRTHERDGPIHMLNLVRLREGAGSRMGATPQARKLMPHMGGKVTRSFPVLADALSGVARLS